MISRLVLKNWLAYRGEHVLDLEAKAYAIHAHRADLDPDRSNWCGKSALVESIRFALYGVHRHDTEDGWITNGEKEGSVRVEMPDGAWIERSRVRGKTTVVRASFSQEKESAKDRAQEEIARHLALSEEDYRNTCDWAQGEMARIITLRPAQRTEIVSQWLGLAPLEKALDLAKSDYRSQLRALEAIAAEEKAVVLPEERDVAALERELQTVASEVAQLEAALDEARLLTADYERWKEAEQLRQEAAGLEKAIAAAGKVLVRDPAAETAAEAEAARDLRQKRQLAAGVFDGACPVASIQCPAKDQILAQRAHNASLLEAARLRHGEADRALSDARTAQREGQARVQELERLKGRLDGLRVQIARAPAQAPPVPGDLAALRQDLDAARRRQQEAATAVSLAREANAQRERAAALVATLRTKREEAAADLRICKDGVGIFRDALRVVAEGNLARIERRANQALVAAGVDLQVAVSWVSEGKDLAKDCAECGEPFPSSRKVRACARCGAERGPNLIQELTIEPSNVSGAANDLAGIFVQFAASAWVRSARGSTWATACLDEPVAQLDRANRRSFAAALPRLLAASAFRQAFVVAHTPETLEALPGRIVIVNEGGNATPKVIV